MTTHLLDVNVLVALLDPVHVHHERAHRWFHRTGRHDWMSCPTTENGCVRIVSNPRYGNPAAPATVIASLRSLTEVGKHRFVPDDVCVLDDTRIDAEKLVSSAQLTDTYLIALARRRHASLATLDTRIVTSAARSVSGHVVVQIP